MSALVDVATIDGSGPALLVAAWIEEHGIEAVHAKIDEMLDQCPNVDLAAHDYDWRDTWARPKQVPPDTGWESFGYLAGRGNGKTLSLSKFVNEEVEEGRANLVCLIAQDEDSSIKLHVTGPSGLIATAKPWFKPEWRASALELVWPNGARAYVRTPEVPGKIRGLEYHLTWASELQSWPDASMREAWMNVMLSTRLGLARIVWDATAKRRHPLLTDLLKEGEADPERHKVVRGSTYENVLNLGRGYIEKIERKYGGTRQGEEELFAKMFTDADGATSKQEWIDKARRPRPDRFSRTAVAIDPAITARAGSDMTGIVVGGLCLDGQGMVIEDLSGKHTAGAWAELVIDAYFKWRCDCVVVETNKGGDLVARNLRAANREGVTIVVLGKDEKPRHLPGIVYVREVFARGEKADRAKPLGTAYERGRISHMIGATLTELEELLTTWIPSPGKRSPDRLDAAVHLFVELLRLNDEEADPKSGFVGFRAAAEAVAQPVASAKRSTNIARILGYGHGSRRI